nr:hypothetical protein [uncultured Fluviicola sp.]
MAVYREKELFRYLDKMTRKKRILITLTVTILLLVGFLLYRWISYPLLHVEYNGKITDYHFDIKGYSEFEIDHKDIHYQMHYLDCDLKIGDSMVKKMDETYIYHYRNGKLIGKYSSIMGYRYAW